MAFPTEGITLRIENLRPGALRLGNRVLEKNEKEDIHFRTAREVAQALKGHDRQRVNILTAIPDDILELAKETGEWVPEESAESLPKSIVYRDELASFKTEVSDLLNVVKETSGSPERGMNFFIGGDIAIDDTAVLIVPLPVNVDYVAVKLETPADGAGVTANILQNGTMIHTVSIPAGATEIPDAVLDASFAEGDKIAVTVTAAGDTVAGSDLTVMVKGIEA